MAESLVASLVVSGLGMLMLFVAMIALYGLMYGMTALIKDPPSDEASSEVDDRSHRLRSPGGREGEQRQAAAAIAVALARAELDVSAIEAPETGEAVSAWWSLHHGRRLTHNRRSPGSRNRS